ncbi:MAG: aminotransferase class I/II-fold pyridoxal phosphate-dependent enzyme, partial [Clostridia bacterium]
MYSFINDYSEGAAREIIDELVRTNFEQTVGYGNDDYCAEARELISRKLDCPSAHVHFLVGGTQTNLTIIAAALRPHQGVVSAVSGHINIHEAGAIEATGHKVLPIPSTDGKIYSQDIDKLFESHFADGSFDHIVQPGMVYISNPTEIGTIYSKRELTAISAVCKKWNVPLFMDGARLGCALTADKNDLTLADITKLCDAYYIGGTKMGALFGEAVVLNNEELNKDFRYLMKQKGGLFAKGRLLGIQFKTLFSNDLYFRLARHANDMAKKLSDAFQDLGYSMLVESMSNQIFPILPKTVIAKLGEKFKIGFWESFD